MTEFIVHAFRKQGHLFPALTKKFYTLDEAKDEAKYYISERFANLCDADQLTYSQVIVNETVNSEYRADKNKD